MQNASSTSRDNADMTKRYFMLQRKLEDAESELKPVFSLPASGTPSRHLLSRCIRQRLLFLNTLLSAEFTSGPERPQHLHHVARRLADLEAAFRAWDGGEEDEVCLPEDEDVSVCSCTESCLRDDDGGEDEKEDPPVDEWHDLLVAEEGGGSVKGLESEERGKEGREKAGQRRKSWRVVNMIGGAAAVGAVVAATFSGIVLRHLDRGDAFVATPT